MGEVKSQPEESLFELLNDQARKIPRRVTNMVRLFKLLGRKASNVGDIIVQFRSLPPIMAPNPSATIGAIIEGV